MAAYIAQALPEASPSARTAPRTYAWIVFALTFGLLLSDYMSRQVLNAVFPVLKAEWSLSDTQLGSLSSIVALLVGILTFPLSVVADRWGRVKSVTLMATLWSLATLGCAISANYNQMFAARFFVGVGGNHDPAAHLAHDRVLHGAALRLRELHFRDSHRTDRRVQVDQGRDAFSSPERSVQLDHRRLLLDHTLTRTLSQPPENLRLTWIANLLHHRRRRGLGQSGGGVI